MDKIYLDYAATTPVDERVLQAMIPYFLTEFGNPSSVHTYGQSAEAAVESARATLARQINARPDEILFTSCGTESDNLALRGVAWAQRIKRDYRHILVSPVEHPAVLNTARSLGEEGFEIEYLNVDTTGMVDPDDVRAAIRPDTALVSVIYANNEIGTINPIQEIGAVCRGMGVPFHSDAVQAGAHLKLDVQKDRVDLISLGAHKLYGPKGVGMLYVRNGTPIVPMQTGGKQENGLRAGTQNVPYIVGLAEAFNLAQTDLQVRQQGHLAKRDYVIGQVLESIPRAKLTGHAAQRLPNHASFTFEGVDGNQLAMMLDIAGYACSSGSACKTGSPKPSEVLTAIGLSAKWALGSLRVTLGRGTTQENLIQFAQLLPDVIQRQRSLRN